MSRRLPPAGNCPSILSIVQSFRELRKKFPDAASVSVYDVLRALLYSKFPKSQVRFAGSGTSALFQALSTYYTQSGSGAVQKKKYVFMSAYTCPDVAAAVIRAGYKIALLDIHVDSFQLRAESSPIDMEREASGIIFSNLYGLADNLLPWTSLNQNDFFLIDDACQGGLSLVGGRPVGERGGNVGILSFGRGKAFSAFGGGVVLTQDTEERRLEEGETQLNFADELKHFILGLGFSTFSHPALYGIVEKLPFLRLGETSYHPDFSLAPLSRVQAAAGLAALNRVEFQREIFLKKSLAWHERLKALGVRDICSAQIADKKNQVAPIRYPILCESEVKRDELFLHLFRAGYGVSKSYPITLEDYPELKAHLVFGNIDGAKSVARRILTLPTHQYVTESIQNEVTTILKNYIGG